MPKRILDSTMPFKCAQFLVLHLSCVIMNGNFLAYETVFEFVNLCVLVWCCMRVTKTTPGCLGLQKNGLPASFSLQHASQTIAFKCSDYVPLLLLIHWIIATYLGFEVRECFFWGEGVSRE